MEVASSSSATGKLKVFSRLESGLRLIEISARHSQVPLEVTIPFLTTLGQTCTPASPEVACARVALTSLNLNDAPRMCTQRGAEAPLGRAVSSRFAPVGSDAPETAPPV